MFKYVLIPAGESEPIQTLTASKAGGLSDDELAKNAKNYFFEQGGGAAQAKALEDASPEEKKQLAQQIRDQYASSPASKQVAEMDDASIFNLLKAQTGSATCEITCLTVPMPLNGHKAVSMYGDDNARNKDYPLNKRATALMKACGHALPADASNEDGKPSGMCGDIFVGRCHDNEMDDIWERIDLTADDIAGDLDKVEWCRTARKKGGGGGHGGAAASLSNTLQKMSKGQGGDQEGGSAAAASPPVSTGIPGENEENGYKWSQTDEEVEIRFAVAPGTKAKYVKVKFGYKSLKVAVAGQTLCDGDTWGSVAVDESTFTIQDDPNSEGRELSISLSKKEKETWNFAVMTK
jgi:hypothetical protein